MIVPEAGVKDASLANTLHPSNRIIAIRPAQRHFLIGWITSLDIQAQQDAQLLA